MYLLDRVDAWSERHHPKWMDLIRIVLGLVLFWKGFFFIYHSQSVISLLDSTSFGFYSMTIAHYVIIAHIVGGVLIAFGLLTRAAVLFQIPALIGAIAYAGLVKEAFSTESDIVLAVLVLMLAVLFLVEGSGQLSIDMYLKRHPDS